MTSDADGATRASRRWPDRVDRRTVGDHGGAQPDAGPIGVPVVDLHDRLDVHGPTVAGRGQCPSTGARPIHSLGSDLFPGSSDGDGRRVSSTTDLGAHGERIAAAYLTDVGLRLLDRNWRCREGELDIVAREGDALVFCEVKTRRGTGYGHPVEAVTVTKQRRLRVLAQRWLAAHDEHAPDLRFDVVGVLVRPSQPALVTHLRAAFS
jgi:putative endonuclease